MSSPPATLAAAQLLKLLRESYENQRLGASGVLLDLGRVAQDCATRQAGPARTVAFVLSRLFLALGEDRSDRAVTADENDIVLREYQVLSRAALFINGEGRDDPQTICEELIAIYFRLLPARGPR